MSIKVADIDLTTANIGDKFTISLQNVGLTSDPSNYKNVAHLRFFNDSCMGFDANEVTAGQDFYIPQGAWPTINLTPGETAVKLLATSQSAPTPAVCHIVAVYYASGEPLDDVGVLGNTPQNLGGTITTSSVQTLSNETSATPVLVIDMGTLANPSQIQIYNDGHFNWSMIIGGVSHTLMQGTTTGSPLQLGEAGDITEILGQLKVDQTTALGVVTIGGGLTFAGGDITMNGHEVLGAGLVTTSEVDCNSYHDSAGNDGMVITPGTTNRIQNATRIAFQVPGGTEQAAVTSTQLIISSGNSLKLPNGNTIQGISSFSCSASGTFNHNFGSTPFFVILYCTASPSTTTYSIGAISSTQVVVTLFNAISMKAMCFG